MTSRRSTGNKRRRVDDGMGNEPDPPFDETFEDYIEGLDREDLVDTLIELAEKYVVIRRHLVVGMRVQESLAVSRDYDFEQQSKNVWHTMSTRYAKLSGEQQHDAKDEALQSVENEIKCITSVMSPESTFATKKSAVATLQKIGDAMCHANGAEVMTREMRKFWDYENPLVDEFVKVVLFFMTAKERQRLRVEDPELVERIKDLDVHRRQQSILCDFRAVRKLVEGSTDKDLRGEERGAFDPIGLSEGDDTEEEEGEEEAQVEDDGEQYGTVIQF